MSVLTPLSNALFYGWQQVRSGASIRSTFFGRGECVIGGGTREPSFFLAVRKERSRHSLLLGDGGTAGSTSVFDAFVPFYGGIPCRFFIACGRPNHERSSPPLLTVLLLLTREHQEEGDGASNEGTWRPLRCGHLGGLFLPLGRGNLGTFPRLTERTCSPTAPLPFQQNAIGGLRHSKCT